MAKFWIWDSLKSIWIYSVPLWRGEHKYSSFCPFCLLPLTCHIRIKVSRCNTWLHDIQTSENLCGNYIYFRRQTFILYPQMLYRCWPAILNIWKWTEWNRTSFTHHHMNMTFQLKSILLSHFPQLIGCSYSLVYESIQPERINKVGI